MQELEFKSIIESNYQLVSLFQKAIKLNFKKKYDNLYQYNFYLTNKLSGSDLFSKELIGECDIEYYLDNNDIDSLDLFLTNCNEDNLTIRIRCNDFKHLAKQEYILIIKSSNGDVINGDNRKELELKIPRMLAKVILSRFEKDSQWNRVQFKYTKSPYSLDISFNSGYGWVAELELCKESINSTDESLLDQLREELCLDKLDKNILNAMYNTYLKRNEFYLKVFDEYTPFSNLVSSFNMPTVFNQVDEMFELI